MSALTDAVTNRSADEVREHFATLPAVEVVGLLAGADRSELVAIAEDGEIWTACVDTVIHRFGEFAHPEGLAKVEGVVAMHIVEGKVRREHALPSTDRGCRVVDAGFGRARPAAGARCGRLPPLDRRGGQRGVPGAGRPVEDHRGRSVGAAVGGVFQVPGQPGVAVDPTDIDPDEVAGSSTGSSTSTSSG